MSVEDKIAAGSITIAEVLALPAGRRERLLLDELNRITGKPHIRPQTLTDAFDETLVAFDAHLESGA